MVGRAIDAEDVICEGCRRIVEEHRRTGNSFQHVSAISSYHWTLEVPTYAKIKIQPKFFFVQKFVDMNHNQRGRIPKHKRSILSKEKSDGNSAREMVVVSSERLLEMEEKLRILSASK